MAGIGFSLKKALGGRGRFGKWRVYGAAAFVAAGPWLLTLVSLLLLLGWGSAFGLPKSSRDLLLATVTYAMIGSNLISTSAQFFLTRYLADALYVRAHERLLSGFVGIFAWTGTVALVLSVAWQFFLPLPFAYRVWTVLLTVLLTQLGLLMILLSAAKAFQAIAIGFLAGLLFLAVALVVDTVWQGYWQAGHVSEQSLLLGVFTCGQGVTFLLLGGVALRDFSGQIPALYEWRAQYRRYPHLIWIGLCYAVTLWVDNALYWAAPGHVVVAHSYVLAPAYDVAKFWTFLALIPGFTMFTLHVETAFYQAFRQFYDAIERGETLAPIRIYEETLRTETKAALLGMAKVQLFVAVVVWVIAQQFAGTYADVVQILQWAVLGSVPFMVWVTAFLLLLYFDARKQAMQAMVSGAVLLIFCTKVAIWFNWKPGTGYLLGSLMMLAVTLSLLNQQTGRLLYYAFHDPNDSKQDLVPPATRATARQKQVGYPILEVSDEHEVGKSI